MFFNNNSFSWSDIDSNDSVLNDNIESNSDDDSKFNIFKSFYNMFKGEYSQSYIQRDNAFNRYVSEFNNKLTSDDTNNITNSTRVLNSPQVQQTISNNIVNQHQVYYQQVHQQISNNIINQHNQSIHQTNTQLFSINNPLNPLGIYIPRN